MKTKLPRRSFLKLAAAGGLAAGIGACTSPEEFTAWLESVQTNLPEDLPQEMGPLRLSDEEMNLWTHEIDLASPLMVDNPPQAIKHPDIYEDYNGLLLRRLEGRHFYGSLSFPVDQLNWEIFTPGHDYLLSYYVRSAVQETVFFWMRPLAALASLGHAPKLAAPQVRRVWEIVRATGANQIGILRDPTRPLGEQGSSTLQWFFQGQSNGTWQVDLRMGGFMVQDLGEAALGETLRSGVAVMGDSTTEGSAVGIDHPMAREWSSWAAALLNVPFYNRARYAWSTFDMLAEWDNRITPLAQNCRFCIIQGGINDLAIGYSLEIIQQNFQELWALAESQGMLPILTTVTPFDVLVEIGREADRQALNEWIKGAFVRVLDFDSVIRDPDDPSSLRKEDDWYGDGGHFGEAAKKALGEYVAAWEGWDLPTPGEYN